jgi:hypothetical protein
MCPKPAIHRGGVAVPEVLDDHVEAFHEGNLSRRAWSAIRPQVVRPCALTHATAASGGRPKRATSAAAITITAGVETISDTLVRVRTHRINSADPMSARESVSAPGAKNFVVPKYKNNNPRPISTTLMSEEITRCRNGIQYLDAGRDRYIPA